MAAARAAAAATAAQLNDVASGGSSTKAPPKRTLSFEQNIGKRTISESSLDQAIDRAEKEVRDTADLLQKSLVRANSFTRTSKAVATAQAKVEAKVYDPKLNPPTPPPSTASPKLKSPTSSPLVPRKGLSGLTMQPRSASMPPIPFGEAPPPEEDNARKEARDHRRIFNLLLLALIVGGLIYTEQTSSSTKPPPATSSTSEIDLGDTTWMLISTMSVLLMVPALGLFEAGLLRAKNSVSVLMQCFVGLAVLSVLWFLVGFSLCFAPSPDLGAGLWGGPTYIFFRNVPWNAALPQAPTIPGVLFAAFQCMFASITPLLCTGAFAERLRFEAFLLFLILWSLFVYYPLCHWIWGGGWLSQLGVVDFAGGIVIHTAAGVASLVTALKLGPRAGFTGVVSGSLAPHNLPMAATGAGLLWFGWFSFNGGSALASGALAASTLMTTHIAGAAGTLAWLVLDWIIVSRPTFVGVINGALSGLAGVTPASGFVTPSAGFVIGLLCGIGSYGGVHLFKELLRVDDALDVSSIHGVTGITGSLLLGLYSSTAVNSAGPEGSIDQLFTQGIGVLVAIGWSGCGTYLVMIMSECLMGSTRIDEDGEVRGLDNSQHGESSYLDLHALV